MNIRPIRVLLILTGGLLDDGVTSWAKQIFSAMNHSSLVLEIIAWEDTKPEIIKEFSNLGFIVKIIPSRRNHFGTYIKELNRILKNNHYNIVHVCGSSAIMSFELMLSRCAGVEMRISHSHNTTCSHKLADKILRPLLYASATDYLACGIEAGKWLFDKKNFTIIPNGKNLSEYSFSPQKRRTYRNSLGLSAENIAIGHIGRFNEQKNHRFLVGVFSELKKKCDRYKFFFIGSGELQNETKKLINDAGLDDVVFFLGSRSDVPSLINAMDCMVLPSLYEGFPNVVVEWQINGLPCVISDSITKECALTPLVSFLSLSESASEWANAIGTSFNHSCRKRDSVNAVSAVSNAGYDITKDAETLRVFYFKGVRR